MSHELASLPSICQLKVKNRMSSDITNFTCILLLHGLSSKKSFGFFKCVLDMSWKLLRLDLYKHPVRRGMRMRVAHYKDVRGGSDAVCRYHYCSKLLL